MSSLAAILAHTEKGGIFDDGLAGASLLQVDRRWKSQPFIVQARLQSWPSAAHRRETGIARALVSPVSFYSV